VKTLCRGSMRAGERSAAPPAPLRLVACVLCGRVFATMRPHTAQVPRHLRPKVVMHRRGRCLVSRRGCTVAPVGTSAVTGGLAAVAGDATMVPAWIPVGDLILRRTAGDFADELVYCGNSGDYTFWVKSRFMLDGPWDWIIEEGRSPIDLGGPFLTREEVTTDLAASLVAAGIACPEAPDEVVSVAAATITEPATPPRSTAAASALHADQAAAAGRGTMPDNDDPELLGLALDMAMVALRRARARLQTARAA
jgi:hypothetical protein